MIPSITEFLELKDKTIAAKNEIIKNQDYTIKVLWFTVIGLLGCLVAIAYTLTVS